MEESDERLWQIARNRADFRRNLYSYIIVTLFLWAIWWFTSGSDYMENRRGIPWPCWVMLGWGLGLARHYYKAYYSGKETLTEQEYRKLKERKNL